MARLGVLGGSFNPVHLAHLVVAERVREALGLERVLFVPAARQPLKPGAALAPGEDRLAMLRLALAGNPAFEATALELERGGTSYTVDTLRDLRAREPDAELFLLLGSDAFRLIDRWRESAEIRRLARIVVVPRPGAEPSVPGPAGRHGDEPTAEPEPAAEAEAQPGAERAPRAEPRPGAEPTPLVIEVPAMDISASDIRARVARGASIRYLVPETVRQHILARGLYR